MLKNQREREIINFLNEKGGFATVKELCGALFASESSIRRDLSSLEGRGEIKRSYGGAELVKNFSNVVSFSRRTHHNAGAKKAIAKKAARLVKDGSIIFLDQSSTAFYLAAELAEKSAAITVVTNNIEIISLLSNTGIKTVCSGGCLSSENRICLVGSDAGYIFEHTYADMLFFSSRSLSDDGVISDCTREEVTVRASMLKNAEKRIFLCDSEKFGTRSAYKQCTLADIDILISEDSCADRFAGLKTHIAASDRQKLIVL